MLAVVRCPVPACRGLAANGLMQLSSLKDQLPDLLGRVARSSGGAELGAGAAVTPPRPLSAEAAHTRGPHTMAPAMV